MWLWLLNALSLLALACSGILIGLVIGYYAGKAEMRREVKRICLLAAEQKRRRENAWQEVG